MNTNRVRPRFHHIRGGLYSVAFGRSGRTPPLSETPARTPMAVSGRCDARSAPVVDDPGGRGAFQAASDCSPTHGRPSAISPRFASGRAHHLPGPTARRHPDRSTGFRPEVRIRSCASNKRPSGRFSRPTRKLVPAGRRTPPWGRVGGSRGRRGSISRATRLSCPLDWGGQWDHPLPYPGSGRIRRIHVFTGPYRKTSKKDPTPKTGEYTEYNGFYSSIFLIFQYLSLWKSVFTSN